MDIQRSKVELRLAIKDRLSRLSPKDRIAENRSLSKRILEAIPADAKDVCAYAALADEADMHEAILELLKCGHRIFLPRAEGGGTAFRRVTDLSALKLGRFGILEPDDSAPLLDPKALSIALIPGRAFDRKGNRLGRGNGGYDIWMARQRKENPATQFWGIALECQIVQEIPAEAHDQTVDTIITARGNVMNN